MSCFWLFGVGLMITQSFDSLLQARKKTFLFYLPASKSRTDIVRLGLSSVVGGGYLVKVSNSISVVRKTTKANKSSPISPSKSLLKFWRHQ